MKRIIGLSLFLLLFTSFAMAQEKEKEKNLQIRWFGQSFFQVTSTDGIRIVFDPHAMTEYGRPLVKADLVLMSHLHNDHSQWDVLENADELRKVESERVFQGVSGRRKGREVTPIEGKFKSVKFRNVASFHDPEEGFKRGANSIFVVEVDGLKIVHLGDLGHVLSESQVKEIGAVDILMIPVGGIYTINGSNAKDIVKALKPRLYILPMHYGTKVLGDLADPTEFLDGQKNIRKIETNLLSVPVNLKLDNPTIVMMGFENSTK